MNEFRWLDNNYKDLNIAQNGAVTMNFDTVKSFTKSIWQLVI